jgi:hypothetical protein
LIASLVRTSPGPETKGLKIELDGQERRTVCKSLVERRRRLIEHVEDTTQPRAERRSALRELVNIKSVLRKMSADDGYKNEIGALTGTDGKEFVDKGPSGDEAVLGSSCSAATD